MLSDAEPRARSSSPRSLDKVEGAASTSVAEAADGAGDAGVGEATAESSSTPSKRKAPKAKDHKEKKTRAARN